MKKIFESDKYSLRVTEGTDTKKHTRIYISAYRRRL